MAQSFNSIPFSCELCCMVVDVTVQSHSGHAYLGLFSRPPFTLRSRGVVSHQTHRFRAKKEHLETLRRCVPGIQGQNLSVTALNAPYSVTVLNYVCHVRKTAVKKVAPRICHNPMHSTGVPCSSETAPPPQGSPLSPRHSPTVGS